MDRRAELELIAATLEETSRTAIRAALLAQGVGNFAFVQREMSKLVHRCSSLRWAALLMALESTEIRMGGAVRISTPKRIYDSIPMFKADGPPPLEAFDEFTLKTFPGNDEIRVRPRTDSVDFLELRTKVVLVGSTEKLARSLRAEAIGELVEQLAAHLCCDVTVVVE